MNRKNLLLAVLLSGMMTACVAAGTAAFAANGGGTDFGIVGTAEESEEGAEVKTFAENYMNADGITSMSSTKAYAKSNVASGANHGVVPAAAWAGTITVAEDSWLMYRFQAEEGNELTSMTLTFNAKIWGQNNGTAYSENAIYVYAGSDANTLAEVKRYGQAGTAYVDYSLDLSEYAKGQTEIYIKIRLNLSTAVGETQSLAMTGVKLASVGFEYTEAAGQTTTDPTMKTVEIFDDYLTTKIGSSQNVAAKKNVCGGASSHGIVPASAWGDPINAGPAYLVYKAEVPVGATFESLLFTVNARVWNSAGYSAGASLPGNNIKIYVSEDGESWGDAVLTKTATDSGSAADIVCDLSEYVKDFSKAFVKLELNHEETAISLSYCGIKVYSVRLTAEYDGSKEIVTEPYAATKTAEDIFAAAETENLKTGTIDGAKYLWVSGDAYGHAVFALSADELKEFYNLSLSMKIRCTSYDDSSVENALSVYVSADGKEWTLVKAISTDRNWTAKTMTADFGEAVRGLNTVYIKVAVQWPSDNNNSRDWIAFGDMSFTGGITDRKVFEIRYHNAEGAANENPVSYTRGSETAITDAEKEHYDFGGWYTDEALTTAFTGITAETLGNIDLYAKWIPHTFVMTFDANGGRFADGTEEKEATVSYGLTVPQEALPEAPTKENGEFIGWFKDAEFTSAWVFEGDYGTADVVSGAVTLYAKYGSKISVTFRYDDGATQDVIRVYDENEKAEAPAQPSLDGYVFGGWYDGDAAYDFDRALTGDLVLTAKWYRVYSIAYLGTEDGRHGNPASYIEIDSTIVLEDAERTGYIFDGWYEGENKVESIDPSVKADISLTAGWTAKTYTLTVTTDEHSSVSPHGGVISFEGMTFTASAEEGYRVSLVTVNGVRADVGADGGFTVKGIDGDVTVNVVSAERYVYGAGVDIDFASSSVWQNNVYDVYNVTTNTLDGSHVGWLTVDDKSKEGYIVYAVDVGENKSINTAVLSATARVFQFENSVAAFGIYVSTDGKNFTLAQDYPCYTDGGKHTAVELNLTPTAKGQRTIYVKYVLESGNYDWVCVDSFKLAVTLSTVTVTFRDGQNVLEAKSDQVKGEKLVLIEAPVKDGYVFLGWYTDEGLTEALPGDYVATQAVSLYAKWRAETYEITYETDGGESGDNAESYTIEDGFALADAYKEGYKFLGWYLTADYEGEKIDEIAEGSFGAITLYAKFLKGETIVYELNGGENDPDNPRVYFSDEETELFDATREGYVFAGWYLDAELSLNVSSIGQGTEGEITLYAGWIEDSSDGSSSGGSQAAGGDTSSGGCGSIAGAGSAAIVLAGAVAAALRKKKDE